MNDYKLNCEHFLAIARRHLFAGDLTAPTCEHADGDENSACSNCSENPHRGTVGA